MIVELKLVSLSLCSYLLSAFNDSALNFLGCKNRCNVLCDSVVLAQPSYDFIDCFAVSNEVQLIVVEQEVFNERIESVRPNREQLDFTLVNRILDISNVRRFIRVVNRKGLINIMLEENAASRSIEKVLSFRSLNLLISLNCICS